MSEQYDEKFADMQRRNAQIRKWKLQGVREFVIAVNKRAEEEILKTGKIEGAHHRAIQAELKALSEHTIIPSSNST